MKITKLTKTMCNKYPKTFKKFLSFKKWGYDGINYFLDMRYWASLGIKIPCYCSFEKFFEKSGIIINVFYCKSATGKKSGRYELFDKDLEMLYNTTFVGKSKKYAKEKAILKACEILEENIK